MTRRALVLGAGGPAAEAWEIGIIAGMVDAGLDVRNADLFIGTSAGARVAVQINNPLKLEELYERQLDPGRREKKESPPPVDFHSAKELVARAKEGGGDATAVLKRVGAAALKANTMPEPDRRREIAAQLSSKSWPEASIIAVAVNVATGERHIFDRSTGVSVIDAVTASCAAPGIYPPATIEGARYMDGGTWSTENADLAANFDRVLILTLPAGDPPLRVVSLANAEEQLRRNGAHVMIVQPDDATKAAFASVGGNILDPAVRPKAACAGREQGLRIASADSGSNISTVWREMAEVR